VNRIDISPRRRHHRGAALVIVLLVVLIILGVASSLFRLSVIQHRQSRQFELQSQADWLARGGVDRAVARLANSDFTNDSWRVDLGEFGPVEVVTRVIVSKKTPSHRRVESHVRLAPKFARTPVHGYAIRTIGPKQTATKDSP